GRLGKTLWTEGDEGDLIRLRGLWDGEAEARFVGEEIEAMQARDKALDLKEIAILVRTGAQTREFEERFITLGLPYRVVGGPRFYERMEIRDALAYLRVIQSFDDDLAFERIMNKPKRGLGNATLQLLYQTARAGNVPLTLAVRRLLDTDELRPAARRALGTLMADFDRWREMAETTPHPELAEMVLEESGYTEMWMNDKSLEAPGRLENLKELVNAMGEFETLAGFLEHVSLVMEAISQEGQDVITIMTLHAAKGLEFDTVFLPGWEEGLFPNQRALDETGRRGLEEERRLAYVGLTRARKRVIISFAANRRMHGSWAAAIPSRFVDELPGEHVAQESDQGIYGAASSAFGGMGGGMGEGMGAWREARVSPGLSRARARQGQESAPFIDVTPTRIETIGSGAFQRGDRVFHQKFGYGSIASVEGERLNIRFDKAGDKKVIASFVVPADQAG
ncbi:uvrD, partial [Symbiodinium microadriaticum]